eukprot:3628134-Alexandrium_andersonii.AAC.1
MNNTDDPEPKDERSTHDATHAPPLQSKALTAERTDSAARRDPSHDERPPLPNPEQPTDHVRDSPEHLQMPTRQSSTPTGR